MSVVRQPDFHSRMYKFIDNPGLFQAGAAQVSLGALEMFISRQNVGDSSCFLFGATIVRIWAISWEVEGAVLSHSESRHLICRLESSSWGTSICIFILLYAPHALKRNQNGGSLTFYLPFFVSPYPRRRRNSLVFLLYLSKFTLLKKRSPVTSGNTTGFPASIGSDWSSERPPRVNV